LLIVYDEWSIFQYKKKHPIQLGHMQLATFVRRNNFLVTFETKVLLEADKTVSKQAIY